MKKPRLDIFTFAVNEDDYHCGSRLNDLIKTVCHELSLLDINSLDEAFPVHQSLSEQYFYLGKSGNIMEGETTDKNGREWVRVNSKKICLLSAWFALTESLPLLTSRSRYYLAIEGVAPGDNNPYWDHGVSHLIDAMHLISLHDMNSDNEIISRLKMESISGVAMKGGNATAARMNPAKKLAQEIAQDNWDEWKGNPKSSNCPRLNETAISILAVISADTNKLGIASAPTIITVKKWIRGLAPEEALKKGRPKKGSPPA